MTGIVSAAAERARRPTLRPGWRAALAALALAGLAVWLLNRAAGGDQWLVDRGAVIALGLLFGGLTAGSNTVVGLANAPALGTAVVGLDRAAGFAWWQALVIGLLWYLASESAWASISARTGAVRAAAVRRQRIGEVATVVAVTASVVAAGIAVSALAPSRTALVKGVAVILVLSAMAVVARQLVGLADRHRSTAS